MNGQAQRQAGRKLRDGAALAGVRAELAVKVFGDDFDELARLGNEIATMVIGGIVSATLLTLIVVPALYHIVHARD